MPKFFYSIYTLIIQINLAFVSRLCSIGNDRDRSPVIYVGLHQPMLSISCACNSSSTMADDDGAFRFSPVRLLAIKGFRSSLIVLRHPGRWYFNSINTVNQNAPIIINHVDTQPG